MDRRTHEAIVEHPAPPPSPGGISEQGGIRVLLVEDDVVTSRLMAELLFGAGYSVRTANSFAEALEVAPAGFDLVVSDLGLPDGSGLDLMGLLRDRHGLRGIALTGYTMDEDIPRGCEAGFVAHLTKPIDFAELDAMIQRVASRSDS
jgi:CheY-like chemotaxis protein